MIDGLLRTKPTIVESQDLIGPGSYWAFLLLTTILLLFDFFFNFMFCSC